MIVVGTCLGCGAANRDLVFDEVDLCWRCESCARGGAAGEVAAAPVGEGGGLISGLSGVSCSLAPPGAVAASGDGQASGGL